MADSTINDVSDTALWVAVYRDQESKRSDALFKDPYAGLLAGEKGKRIAASMPGSRYTAWSIITRTYIIDAYIREMINEGIDAVINLGAGLDTRPYRMDLPPALRWVEADFPHMIEMKAEKLASQKPHCRLEQVKIDLSDDQARRAFLKKMGLESRKALVLTEGVIPYLSEEQVGTLADDLHAQSSFRFWIADYYSLHVMEFLRKRRTGRHMKNAPFQFFPNDWFGFFEGHGWKAREVRYLGEESLKLGRPIPAPRWAELLLKLFPLRVPEPLKKSSAYVLLEPRDLG